MFRTTLLSLTTTCSALLLSPSVVQNTLIDAGAALVAGAGPVLVPGIVEGYANMKEKYEGIEDSAINDEAGWRGEFPEFDNTGAPLSTKHTSITIVAATVLFFGAFEEARFILDNGGTDLNDAFAMGLYAFSFQGDSLTHAVLSAGPTKADGNIMQRGHFFDTIPMTLFFLYANFLDGGAWYALTDLPADHYWTLLPRLFTHPIFLLLTFYIWQPAHAAGLWLPKGDSKAVARK